MFTPRFVHYTSASSSAFRPHNNVKLATLRESPVLQRDGFTENRFEKEEETVPTMEGTCCFVLHVMLFMHASEWTFAKQKWLLLRKADSDADHATATIIPGLKEQVYG